jgi:hypothetical protein
MPANKPLDIFQRYGLQPPEHIPHYQIDDIEQYLKKLHTTNWRMEGPGLLVCDTNMGTLKQRVPLDYYCDGTDEDGLPILKKIGTNVKKHSLKKRILAQLKRLVLFFKYR